MSFYEKLGLQSVFLTSERRKTEIETNQTMAVYVPAAYFETDEDGNVTGINHKAAVGNYTADTAPIIYLTRKPPMLG